MNSSYNRTIKPKSTQTSKKNSGISSVLYKEMGNALKDYKQNKINGQTRRDRTSRNSVNIIHEREISNKNTKDAAKAKENKKIDQKMQGNRNENVMPFTKMNNNFFQEEKTQQPIISIFDQKRSTKNIINFKQQDLYEPKPLQKTCKKSFHYKYIIGKGGFGKVWKVQHTKTRNQYAMKQMLKSLVMTKKSVQSVMNERLLLSNLYSPFIVNMQYAFQDRDTLYLVLDLLEGGDLRHHISTKRFSQIQSKFFVSCIILGLQYLHSNKIIHRDIKPQNLVLDSRGYVRITDLGIARIKKTNNSCDTSGTPGYMSPEVLCRMNHTYVSDFYALGVITYEFATGKRPHNGMTRNQIRQQILAKQATIKRNELPNQWSQDCIDFINKLLQRKPQQRLGYTDGAEELKNHPWLRDLNWKKLASRDIQSPYIPLMKKSDFDQDQQITIEDQQQAQIIEKNSLLLRKPQFQQLFKQYYFEPSGYPLQEKQKSQVVSKAQLHGSSKNGVLANARRKNSCGTYNPSGLISTKNSLANLKKTNVSTNNSTQITNGNISGIIKASVKTPEGSSRQMSGNIHKKTNPTVRQSKDNILNVSQVSMIASKVYKQKEKEKQRPFFRN